MAQLCAALWRGARAASFFIWLWELHQRVGVMDRGEEFFQKAGGRKLQAGCVDAGMAADVRVIFQNIPVDQETHTVFFVIHKAQDADRSGGKVQKLFHKFRLGKRKPGASDLLGQGGGAEFFAAGHHQKIEGSFLGIAEKKTLADIQAENAVYLLAGLNGGERVMIQPLIGNAQGIQKIVGSQLFWETALGIFRPSSVDGGIDAVGFGGWG